MNNNVANSSDIINIALLDTGVKIDSNQIQHYIYSNGSFIKIPKSTSNDNHGTYCAKKILNTSQNIQLFDINISDSNHKIKEDVLISAIEFACSVGVDIVSLSMKFSKCSTELYEVCEHANIKDVVVVAADDGEICYPANMPKVISVCIREQKEEIIFNEKILTCTVVLNEP